MVFRCRFSLCCASWVLSVSVHGHSSASSVGSSIGRYSITNASPATGFTVIWQKRLNPLMLPVSVHESGDLVVSTQENRVGLFRGSQVRWWAAVDQSILAASALLLPSSDVATILRDGTFEVRRATDGHISHSSHLPVRDCATSSAVGLAEDGTLSILCGNHFVRIDGAGRCLSSELLPTASSVTMLGHDRFVTEDGKWFYWHRWRGMQQLMGLPDAQVRIGTSDGDRSPLFELLRDMPVVRHQGGGAWPPPDASASQSELLNGALALALTPDGAWLSLDQGGKISRHQTGSSRAVGTIGPTSSVSRGPEAVGRAATLVSPSIDLIVAGWADQPLHWFYVGSTGVLAKTECSGRRQIEPLGAHKLLCACSDGLLVVFART